MVERRLRGVYAVKHTGTGRTYIGQSGNVLGRWREHVSALVAGRHCNRELQTDFDQDGVEAFEFAVIETVTDGSLRDREASHLQDFTLRYNVERVGRYDVERVGNHRGCPPLASDLIAAQVLVDQRQAERDAAIVAAIDEEGQTFYRVCKSLNNGCGRQVITQPTVKAIYERTKARLT